MKRQTAEFWTKLVDAYRAMHVIGPINHSAAAAAAGCSRLTASRRYHHAQGAMGAFGPWPAIKDLLAVEAERKAGTPAQLGIPTPAAPEASAATMPAPPVVVTPAPTTEAPAAPPVPAPPTRSVEDPELAEARLLQVGRTAAQGLASQIVGLLLSLQPMIVATKRSLVASADGGLIDPSFCVKTVESLARSLTQTTAAIERLATVQSILSDRPSQTIRVERTDVPAERLGDDDRAEARQALRKKLNAIGASANEPTNGYRGVASHVIDVEAEPARPLPEPLAEE